jgi:23S rRNA (uracil1939-C5)-methyltransferase
MANFKRKSKGLRQFKPGQRSVPTGHHVMQIDSLADDGRGIARPKGKTTFVSGALPGEQVKAQYSSSRKDFDEAQLVSVIEPSRLRENPACQYFERCGGCSLQHLNYSAQLDHKESQLKRLLGGLPQQQAIDWQPALHAEPYAYRHRVRFSIHANKRGCVIGFRPDQSHQVIDVQQCVIAFSGINQCLGKIRPVILQLSGRSQLRECVISEAEQGVRFSLQLVSKRELSKSDIDPLEQLATEEHWQLQLCLESDLNKPYWQTQQADSFYQLPDFDCDIRYQPTDFTQVNPSINRRMIAQALDWLQLTEQDQVADFFSGVGNFTLPMAKLAGSVKAYELIPAMIEKVTANASHNQLANVQAEQANLFTEKLPVPERLNKALLDPPRAGAMALCQHLAGLSLQRLLYISCNPRTLKRDAELLLEGGFRVEKGCLVDMFPQTRHSEAILLFVKA